MPSNVVKTERQEKLWDEAKHDAESRKKGKPENYWAYVMAVYQRRKGNKTK